MVKSREDSSGMEDDETILGGPACPECTTNCLLNHKKTGNPYCFVNRFFKIMLGDDFSDVLFFPPRFARTMSELVDEETYIADAFGQRYKVKFSEVDGSLAFQEGWREFSVEHGLEEGDFLVFNRIRDGNKSHFLVHIFGLSGCEKLNFPQESGGRKRSTMDTNGVSQDEACKRLVINVDEACEINVDGEAAKSHSLLRDSGSQLVTTNKSVHDGNDGENQQSDTSIDMEVTDNKESHLMVENKSSENHNDSKKSQFVPSIDMEEPLCLLNRDDLQNRDDRICLFDLSSFEMEGNISTADETKTRANGGDMMSQNELGLVDNFPVHREISRSEIVPYEMTINPVENIEEYGTINATPDLTEKHVIDSHSDNPCLGAPQIVKKKDTRAFFSSDSPLSALVLRSSLENSLVAKVENVCCAFSVNGSFKIGKSEPENLDASTSSVSAEPPLLIMDNSLFLNAQKLPLIYEMLQTWPIGQSVPTNDGGSGKVHADSDGDGLHCVQGTSEKLAEAPIAAEASGIMPCPHVALTSTAGTSGITPVPIVTLAPPAASFDSISSHDRSTTDSPKVTTSSEQFQSQKKRRKLDD